MQVSAKRLAANRANALKSTGPKSEAGKRRSSQNRCKHHLYARKFRMPDDWEQWALQRAGEFIKDIEDPGLRPLIFQRIYINGRQKYFVHLCAQYFELIRKNGMGWFIANSDYVTALDRYHAHHYAETIRINRLIRRYHQLSQSHNKALSKPKTLAVGQTLVSRPNEPICAAEQFIADPGRSNPLVYFTARPIKAISYISAPGRSNPSQPACPHTPRPPPLALD